MSFKKKGVFFFQNQGIDKQGKTLTWENILLPVPEW